MAMMAISEFCTRHGACDAGARWAIENCIDMLDVWNKLPYGYMLWVFKRPDVVTKEEALAFAEFCANNAKVYSDYAEGLPTNPVQ